MKKLFTITTVLLFSLGILTGCGSNKLSDDFDEDAVKTAAEEIVDLVNSEDFDTLLNEKSSDEIKSAITVEQLASVKENTMKNAGEFESYKSEAVVGEKADGKDIAVAVLIVHYENQDVKYTLSFHTDLQLCGIYMK